jgi:hypothetical protein
MMRLPTNTHGHAGFTRFTQISIDALGVWGVKDQQKMVCLPAQLASSLSDLEPRSDP